MLLITDSYIHIIEHGEKHGDICLYIHVGLLLSQVYFPLIIECALYCFSRSAASLSLLHFCDDANFIMSKCCERFNMNEFIIL